MKALLEAKKDLIRTDIDLLKAETKPFSDLLGSLSHSERRRRLLVASAGLVGQRIFRTLVVMKTHWLVRPIVQYLDENSRLNFKSLIKRFGHRISSILQKNPIKTSDGGLEETDQ